MPLDGCPSTLVWLLSSMLAAHSPDGSLSLNCARLYAFCSVKSFSDSSLLCTISLIPVNHATLALGNLGSRIALNVFVMPPCTCTAPLFLLAGCDDEI